jgi:3-methyladenine DNA glycosylase AlkD
MQTRVSHWLRDQERAGHIGVPRAARDYLRALAQRVESTRKNFASLGAESELLRTLVAASSAKTAGFGVPSSVPKWRATVDEDEQYCFAVAL